MTDANISPVRDPFVLLENGVYYMYATGWVCYKNTGGRLEGDWVKLPGPICRIPENAVDNFWAPEVHRYKGKFYMFTTYRSSPPTTTIGAEGKLPVLSPSARKTESL